MSSPNSIARFLRPGPLVYQLWHRPVGWVRSFFGAGGPFEQRRTEAGRVAMEAAASRLTPLPVGEPPAVTLHLLTGRRFWFQTAFCLQSFARQARRQVNPIIYDDGTLEPSQCDALARLFPGTRFVMAAETIARLDALLPRARFPVLRDRWDAYPNIRKLTDPHLGSHGWKFVLDSDLLFFREPGFLLRWLDNPARPLHGVDVMNSYGYTDALLAKVASAPLADRLNVGLCGLNSDELDWEHIEHLCRTLIGAERHNYYLEQAIVAVLLAGRSCAVAPAADYLTLPRPPEALVCHAVMHHYVADSKRWYFQHNWRRVSDGMA